jgi:H+/gluconate symporter-like permease
VVCKSCGRSTSNENANFCDYCGASYKEVIFIQNEDKQKKDSQIRESNEIEDGEKTISFRNWVGTLLLPVIPLVGPIIYLVMMLVWAFGSDTNKSKKNWARASLVVGCVFIVLIIFIMVNSFTQLINSGFDMKGYMEQMNQYY